MTTEHRVLLQLEHVSRHYAAPDGSEPVPILRDICLELGAGESLAVVGPSGSGKSTLLNLVGGLDRPSSGRVLLRGRDLAALDDRELAQVRNRELGFVFQLHHLLPQCTVLENVLLPTLPRRAELDLVACEARAHKLLERVGLGTHLDYLPGQLSGGQRQRVAVVRALINGPGILLADEPTGSLDHATAATLAALLLELNAEEGVAVILVTHAPELARRMGRICELRDGRLRQAG